MPRYKLTIEYDGTNYVGWQSQHHLPSIQSALEAAVAAYCLTPCDVTGAGRTDAGVHARGQVAHVDIPRSDDPRTVKMAINHHLGDHRIRVVDCAPVADDFHARFHATLRSYQYLILSRDTPSPLHHNRSYFVPQALDAEAMHTAAQLLVGQHDFSTFRDRECQAKSPIKHLTSIAVTHKDDCIAIDVSAPSFLHHQVRNIVGSLVLVGKGAWQQADFAQALAAKDRTKGGPTAPAHGLYLTRVCYDGTRLNQGGQESAAE